MISQTELDRTLDQWLADGPAVVADRVVESALASVAVTPQVGSHRWSPRARAGLGLAVAGLGAAAVIVVALSGVLAGRPSPLLVGAPSSSPAPSVVPPSPAAGGLIAFLHCDDLGRRSRFGRPECSQRLWLVGADGTDPHPIFDHDEDQGHATWSPDGRQLVFIGWAPPSGTSRLYLSDPSGSAPRWLDPDCVAPCLADSDPAFSPDGRSIAFVRWFESRGSDGTTIATMDLATGHTTIIESTRRSFDLGLAERPQWSPDGTRIAFSTYDKTQGDRTAVFVVEVGGGAVRRLSPIDPPAREPAWSPDGSQLAFSSFVESLVGDQVHTHRELYTIRADGTGLRQLTEDPDRIEPVLSTTPEWLSDGRIRFIRSPQTEGNMPVDDALQVWLIDADGSNAHRLSVPPMLAEATEVFWQPGH